MARQMLVALGAAIPFIAGPAFADGAAQATRYSIQELSFPDDPRCVAEYASHARVRALGAEGQVTGHVLCYVATGNPAFPFFQNARPFRWTRAGGAERLPELAPPGDPLGSESFGRDVNADGTVIGLENGAEGSRAPLWPLGGGVSHAVEPVDCDGLTNVRGESINDAGTVAVTAARRGADGSCAPHPVIRRQNGEEIVVPMPFALVASLNNREAITGNNANVDAIRWTQGGGEVVLRASSEMPLTLARPWEINDRNEVSGTLQRWNDEGTCTAANEARFWTAGGRERRLPGLPDALHTFAFGLNLHRQVVGYSQFHATCQPEQPELQRAVTWCDEQVLDLNRLIPRAAAREVQLFLAIDVNDRGQILARGIKLNEPRQSCPGFAFDPVTGELVYDPTPTCHAEYAFLLTPR